MERVDRSMSYKPSDDWTKDWGKAQEHILDALETDPTEHNAFDVMSALYDSRAFLWVGERSSAVTLLQGDKYTLWLAGGDLAEIAQMWPDAQEHARGLGAKKVVVFGRKGWARTFLREAGFTTAQVILEKQL